MATWAHPRNALQWPAHVYYAASPGSWRAFLTILLHVPILGLTNSTNHPLPFKSQLALACALLPGYLCHVLPYQVLLAHSYQVTAQAQQVCWLLSIMMEPVSPSDGLVCSSRHGIGMLLSFAAILLAFIVPLHVAYFTELSSKQAFLRRMRVPLQSAASLQKGPEFRVLFGWAWCMGSWSALQVWHSIVVG